MSRPASMKVDGIVYWTLMTYDADGILVDADSTPTVAVRKNGASVGDAVTVTKRSATTGIYDCSYNPSGEAEGDCFTIEETATVSSQAYSNSWSIEVQAAERGTDGANTVTPVDVSSDVATILADTDELQQNQNNWLTADVSGLSTFDHTADEVTTDNASRVASKADVSGLSTFDHTSDQVVASNMRGTDGANTIAPVDVSSDVAAILADTNELQLNQGNWLTATGFATPADVLASQGVITAAIGGLNDFDPVNDVVSRVTLVDTTTDLTNGGGGGSCPTAQEIVDAWGNQDQSVYVTQGTLGYYLDAQVSTAGSGGTGLYQATVRVQDTNNNALQGARVNVDGTTLTLTTDSSGEVTFNLDSGVYLLNVSPPAGYETPTGQVLTITSGDPADTVFTLNEGSCSVAWIG